MQISAVIVLFASAAGVVGQATCATAARPQGPAAQTGLCTGTPDGLVQCGAFDGQAKAFFSPPNGNVATLVAGVPVAGEKDQTSAKRPDWFLNCTGGWLYWCQERNTRCSANFALSDEEWCEDNCGCDYAGCWSPFCSRTGGDDSEASPAVDGPPAEKQKDSEA